MLQSVDIYRISCATLKRRIVYIRRLSTNVVLGPVLWFAAGARLFELRFQEPSSNPLAQLAGAGASLGQVDESVISRLLSPATNLLQVAVQAAVTKQLGGAGDGLRSRTRLEDKSADDMQLSDGEDAPNDLWWM
jgi:hypothetical protein